MKGHVKASVKWWSQTVYIGYVLYTSATNKVVDTRSISSLFIDWYGEDNSWQQEFLLYSNVCLRDHKGITGPLGCDMLSHVELCLLASNAHKWTIPLLTSKQSSQVITACLFFMMNSNVPAHTGTPKQSLLIGRG